MKKRLLALILSIILPMQSFAVCTNAVTLLPEGASAPCRGYLFTPEKELELRVLVKDHELLKQEFDLKNKAIDRLTNVNKYSEDIIKLESDKAELWRIRAEDSTKKLMESVANRQEKDLLWMLAGVLLTVGAGYAVHQVGK